jgi:hypothetical protein
MTANTFLCNMSIQAVLKVEKERSLSCVHYFVHLIVYLKETL